VNPSWEIAKSLPAYLPALRAKDVQARPSTDGTGFPASGSEGVKPLPAVRIVTKPAEAIRVNYRVTRAVVPTLWDGDEPEPDAVIHLGMGPTQPVYSIERRAHRTGYRTPDVDGELPEGENEAERDGSWIWYGCPDELETDLDMVRILTRWRRISPVSFTRPLFPSSRVHLCVCLCVNVCV
jgi:pyroglutamyl-peptidase